MTPVEQRSWPRRVLNRLEVDQAVFFAVAARGWQFLAGPVTVALISVFFTLELQGYYYTFWSLIGLQMFFELSLPQVVMTVASHEWEKLSLGPDGAIQGDPSAVSRLASLLRTSMLWYGVAALLFLATTSVAGLVFFSHDPASGLIAWRAPWLALVLFTSLAFCLTPLLTILEGCNQVQQVYRLHFVRSVVGNVAVWCSIPLGAGLWIPVIASLVRIGCELLLIAGRYRPFFTILLRSHEGPRMDWWSEVWPFQWRMGLKGLFGYFNTYVMVPVIFHYHGSVPAGQLGMTWQILSSLQAGASAWVRTRAARFGVLVSRRDFAELDRVFFRVSGIALAVLAAACAAFWLFTVVLHEAVPMLAPRLIAPLPAALFSVAIVCVLIWECQWTYIHAHKQSPFLGLSIAGAVLNGSLVVWWGSQFETLGVAAAFLAVNALFNVPVSIYVWSRSRAEWHRDVSSEADASPP